jgi:hypothetical protein
MKIGLAMLIAAAALAGCGDDGSARAPASAVTTPSASLEVPLKPRHGSKVSGTATLQQVGGDLEVTVVLEKPIKAAYDDILPAHIHTGPCSVEPTYANPNMSAGLTEVQDGRSETTVPRTRLAGLQTRPYSINVHEPAGNQRPIACGDIPRG